MDIILFDCHTHTKFSADSSMDIREALNYAQKIHLNIITTEHIDFDFPGEDTYEFTADEYFSSYKKYTAANNLLLGTEIGMQPQTALRSREFAQSSPFDMIILSIHVLEGHDIYYPEYYQNKNKHTAYSIYLKTMADLLKKHSFGDVLGHIDYICRKAPYNDPNLYYDEFSSYIDSVWESALQNNIIPEINTRRFADESAIKSLIPIYTRYQQMGGRYATIGSDAHTPDNIGYKFKEALSFLKECSLTPIYFRQHKPVLQH
ncbi:histidinol-phosphatase HisJ family protein [Pectinatus sottacetonis]|uniref:histidinol-phosphatase HisJ family protein n=1 Tax=Pectinatus sottacetonis TaxID=1002795 RepID=UPI0018C7260D